MLIFESSCRRPLALGWSWRRNCNEWTRYVLSTKRWRISLVAGPARCTAVPAVSSLPQSLTRQPKRESTTTWLGAYVQLFWARDECQISPSEDCGQWVIGMPRRWYASSSRKEMHGCIQLPGSICTSSLISPGQRCQSFSRKKSMRACLLEPLRSSLLVKHLLLSEAFHYRDRYGGNQQNAEHT